MIEAVKPSKEVDVRRFGLAISLMIGTLWIGPPAYANCLVIDQLDKLQILQARLARDPDTGLFSNDIRQLRAISAGMSNRETLDAVDGNSFTGHGADFMRFLQNTKDLLQGASLHDPQSVRPHFTRAARNNLEQVRDHLTGLRCNDTQIAVESAAASQGTSGGDSDAEDLAEVAENISAIAEEVFQLRSLVIVLAVSIAISVITPIIRRWIILRRRREKRHNTTYPTQYDWENRTIDGMLIDINCHGTKLRHEKDNPLPIGTTIDLVICGEQTTGTVVWSNTHYSGLQFKNLISLKQVDEICAATDEKTASPKTQNGAPKDAA